MSQSPQITAGMPAACISAASVHQGAAQTSGSCPSSPRSAAATARTIGARSSISIGARPRRHETAASKRESRFFKARKMRSTSRVSMCWLWLGSVRQTNSASHSAG